MNVLYIAYPLLTVSERSAGGAEQMLWTLEREMCARGIHTTVAASSGSEISGELLTTGEPCTEPDDFERRNREHHDNILEFVRLRSHQGRPFEVVHDKSGSFWPRAAELDVPVLATLHLPRHFYSPQLFNSVPENVSFNCVSESQAKGCSGLNRLIGVVSNGILLQQFDPNFGPRTGLLWLGRICEEKGTHLALDIAAKAGMPITIAGQVYPFSWHRQYFEREVAPRLNRMPNATCIPSPSAEEKHTLLREAQAVLITSLVDETSSLVAMEAAASGTPVIAFRKGALPEIVKDGETGLLADGVEEAVVALKKINEIKPEICASHARATFSSKKMADAYEHLYAGILNRQAVFNVAFGVPMPR